MTNHIGISASSKNTKNSNKSSDANTPSDDALMISTSPTSAGAVSSAMSHTQQSRPMNAVISRNGHEIAVAPRCRRAPSGSIHAVSTSPEIVSVPSQTSANSTSETAIAAAPSHAAARPETSLRRNSRREPDRERDRERSGDHAQITAAAVTTMTPAAMTVA